MSRYPEVDFILISPEELRIPEHVRGECLDKTGIPYQETTSLEDAMPKLDILYMTRVQRERFFNEQDYIRLKDSYILTPDKLGNARKDLSILNRYTYTTRSPPPSTPIPGPAISARRFAASISAWR